MGRFDEQVALVTGGGTGIGLACARAIHAEGARVVLAGRREDVLREAAETLGNRASIAPCDVTDDASVDAAVARAAEVGPIRLAVNAAGAGGMGSVLNSTPEQFRDVVEVNLVGVFRCMRGQARAMRAAGGGSIVNVSSIAADLTHRWMDAYCASKAGLNMLTRCAADDLGEHGIRVNAVMPGLIPTDLAAPLASNDDARAEYLRRMPVARLGETGDVARLVAFLLSDDSGWITGQCIAVDGGHTLRQGPDLVPLFRQLVPDEQ